MSSDSDAVPPQLEEKTTTSLRIPQNERLFIELSAEDTRTAFIRNAIRSKMEEEGVPKSTWNSMVVFIVEHDPDVTIDNIPEKFDSPQELLEYGRQLVNKQVTAVVDGDAGSDPPPHDDETTT